MSEKEFDVLNFIEQEWLLHGQLPTAARVKELGLATEVWYKTLLEREDVRRNLLARGIRFADNKGVLTEQQLTAANVMLDLTDNRSRKKKLADLKIPTQLWESWLADPVFQDYLRQRSERIIGSNQHEAHLALLDRVRAGDMSAIKYFNEINGRYVQSRGDTVDLPGLIFRIIEIVQKRVSNNEEIMAIADDLLTLANGVGVAQKPREITVSAEAI